MSDPAINRLASLIEELIEASSDDAAVAYNTRRVTLDAIRELGDVLAKRLDALETKWATNPPGKDKDLSDLEHLTHGRIPAKWLLLILKILLPFVGGGALMAGLHKYFPGTF